MTISVHSPATTTVTIILARLETIQAGTADAQPQLDALIVDIRNWLNLTDGADDEESRFVELEF